MPCPYRKLLNPFSSPLKIHLLSKILYLRSMTHLCLHILSSLTFLLNILIDLTHTAVSFTLSIARKLQPSPSSPPSSPPHLASMTTPPFDTVPSNSPVFRSHVNEADYLDGVDHQLKDK